MRSMLKVLHVAALCWVFAAGAVAADSTRVLKAELSPGASGFKVENLVGTMEVVAGEGASVIVTATVHAESDLLAGKMSVEEVRDDEGRPTLRVVYPLDEHTVYRDPGRAGGWLGGNNNTSTRYAGTKVRVSSREGVLLYADVRVEVPSSGIDGSFRNVAGDIKAEEVSGDSEFDTGSGEITLSGMRGSVGADTGSGDIKATDIEGAFDADTGSGDVSLGNFRGERVTGDTGSGNIVLSEISAEEMKVETGSGNIRATETHARTIKAGTGSGEISVAGSGIESFDADTGSGDVLLDTDGATLTRVSVNTGSGDVEVRLDANASFEAIADQASGDIKNGFSGAEPILRGREVIGYRRGDARTRISVDTGSGDLTLVPR